MSADGIKPTIPADPNDEVDERSRNTVIPVTKARDLLGKHNVLRIEHNGCEYILRLTKNDKLILTK